ncbi:nucleoside monophosphate kinase [Patescibacteria group bacterium]|nr:nucleoside monophosphate kinase [Patescibacteria group bacterium]MBU4600625.1 nucleoside monophosphate kinase [Patescibacteria group bacterium]MCG2698680.1 nucleoside monophosphate kinase [Candidatus Parcubacteria bacterium]
MSQKIFLIFFGPPASGKGTQADKLGEKLNLPVISPGELLRHERDRGTEIGKQAGPILNRGGLASGEIIEKIINKRLAKKDAKHGFLLDGYPRAISQLKFLNNRFKKIASDNDIILAVYIHVSAKEVKRRIAGRRVCDCGASYHAIYNPPKKQGICDLCGAKLYKRKDDSAEIIKIRINRFNKSIKPILKHYKKNNILININGEQSIGEVEKDIFNKLKDKV